MSQNKGQYIPAIRYAFWLWLILYAGVFHYAEPWESLFYAVMFNLWEHGIYLLISGEYKSETSNK